MSIADICIAFTVSILGVAYPLLLTVISRLDDKYSSVLILELFKKEIEWVISKIALIATLLCILIYMVLNLPISEHLPLFVRYIHLGLLVGSLVTLIVFLFLFVKKVLIYFTPNQVLQYFIGKKDNDEHLYFRAIADILYFAIKQQDEVISKTISDYMYRSFLKVREGAINEPVLYPDAYYEVVNKLVMQLASSKNKKFIFLNFRVAGGIWLLGELQDVEIHETTYFNLWRNLITSVEFDRDDMIMHYWGRAHQHFVYQMAYIYEKHSDMDDGFKVLNQDVIDKRNKERKRFLEFNNALGGLLMYVKRYGVIKRMFNYTTSQPPSYDLLPLYMGQIFSSFFAFRDPYSDDFPASIERYYYPDTEGIGSEGLVRAMTGKYFALLFLRQWSIVAYLTTIRPFDFPQVPAKQSEKRIWIEHLPYFKSLVANMLSEPEILKETNLDFITPEWCKANGRPEPLQFIDDFHEILKQSFEVEEISQPVSEDNAGKFYESSKSIIVNTLQRYAVAFNQPITKNYDNWFINGIRMPMEKSPFAENQGVSNLNFDSFVAGIQSEHIQSAISETFYLKTSQQYLLKIAELFAAIDKTGIKPETHIIINFGLHLDHYVQFEKIDSLSVDNYKSIKILSFPMFNRDIMPSGLYLLKKQDLPTLIFNRIEDKEISTYQLRLLDEQFKVFAAVIDLNLSRDIAEEIVKEVPDTDILKSVMLYLAMRIEIRWKKHIKLVALNLYSEYKNSGIPNSIKDVKKF